jgi:DNA-binding MarR family transcriptional regulator
MHPIDFNGLDSAVHGPVRLGILTTLHAEGAKDFSTLKDLLLATDGALGMHLAKLEEVGYLKCQKSFVARRPKSTYTITPEGRRALLKYVETLAAIVELVRAKGDSDLERQPGG